ncbi:MAG TPA: cysteine desulfurase [Methanophagales archaeon]|nr:cysteine desulfurase [Methanophagales archaeon]
MNIKEIRKDFPILDSGIIYMDSAATSLTPEPVLDAVLDYYRNYNANVGRGVYKLTQIASQNYEDAHKNVAKFIGTTANELIFTKNTTEGINTVASGIGLKKEDKVVVSLWEHHSNLLPWIRAKKTLRIDLEVVKPNAISEGNAKTQCALETSDFVDAIDKKTKIVAITHVSNALGSILPVKEISKLCAENNALLLVDAAQSAPHLKIDVRDMGCDFLAFSGHKMLGPTGIGGLVIKEELMDEIEPLTVGGGAVEDASFADYRLKQSYEKFESGTPNIAGAMGLSAAVKYLEAIGMEKVKAWEEKQGKRIIEGLRELDNVEIYGYGSEAFERGQRIGVVSFNVKGVNPIEVASRLDTEANITVRSGHHCCIPLMNYLGLGAEGTVRSSVYLYNTEEEVEKFLELIRKISNS